MTNGYGVFALITFRFIKNNAKRSSQKASFLEQTRRTKQRYVDACKDITSHWSNTLGSPDGENCGLKYGLNLSQKPYSFIHGSPADKYNAKLLR